MPILGLGGQSLIQHSENDAPAIRLIRRAIELGIRYIDTAPLYGKSETRIGQAIAGCRDQVFIATKTAYRLGSSARKSLERSLKRLGTDYVDLLQLHCLMDDSEIGTALGRFGIIRTLEKLKEEGIVRGIGITGHYRPSVLSKMLERYPFDSVLVPVNVADPFHLSFIGDTVESAEKTGASVVAMKVMGAGILTARGIDPVRLLRYALNQKISVAIVSCRSIEDLEMNVRTTREFEPFDVPEFPSLDPGLMQCCNEIYKQFQGRRGLKISARNWLAAQLTRILPGYWHL